MRLLITVSLFLLSLPTAAEKERTTCVPPPAKPDISAAYEAAHEIDGGDRFRKHIARVVAEKGKRYAICTAWAALDKCRNEPAPNLCSPTIRLWLDSQREPVFEPLQTSCVTLPVDFAHSTIFAATAL